MDNLVHLCTKNCSLVFLLSGGRFCYAYFGKRIGDAHDALSLLAPEWHNTTGVRRISGASYPAFGDDDGSPRGQLPPGMDAYGAIRVKHSSGLVSTKLVLDNPFEETETKDGRRVTFFYRDEKEQFFVRQHFESFYGCDVFKTWVEIENREDGAVEIGAMDSFMMEFDGFASSPELVHLASHWAAEGQLCRTKISKGAAASIGSRSGVRGAWQSNPAFILSCDGAACESSGRCLGGALAWSGAWHADVARTHSGAIAVSAGVANPSGAYVLDSGKAIALPEFIFSFSDCGMGAITRSFHKWARHNGIVRGMEHRSILLNSWEGAYFSFGEKTLTDMMDGVKEFGGEMFVIDDGWFGEGEYARDDDRRGLGDWVWNYAKLPLGPEYLAKEAEKRGIALGLWFEPEMANTKSKIAVEHPDWLIREDGRPLRTGRGGTQVVLDMANPAVRDKIFADIDALLSKVPQIKYFKWDANANFMNAGSPFLGKEKQANLWFDYTQGYYELARRLRQKHPHVLFQACSSGGGHLEYGSLGAYASEAWGSDDTDAAMRVLIQWGETFFYPPEAIGSHVTASPNHQTGRELPLKFRFDVASSCRLGFELHPGNIPESDIPFVKEAVAGYKTLRPILSRGNLYRLHSPYDGDFAVLNYATEDGKEAILYVYGLARGIYTNQIPPIRPEGLRPEKRYRIREMNKQVGKSHTSSDNCIVGGDSLLGCGIPVFLGAGYDSAVILISEEEQ